MAFEKPRCVVVIKCSPGTATRRKMAVEWCAREMVQAEYGAQRCVAELKLVMDPSAMDSRAA